MLLTCGGGEVDVPDQLVALSEGRTRPAKFVGQRLRRVLLRVIRGLGSGAAGIPLGSPYAPSEQVQLEGDSLFAQIGDDVFAAEAVLRIAWQIAVHREGGLLMHGCAFHWGGSGVAAIGQSGAGKSTLARLSRAHPGHAALLSDEIVHLTTDGDVYGTPFRSDPDNDGEPGPARLAALLLLQHGAREGLETLSPAEALPVLLGQLYVPVVPVVTSGELRRRLMALVDAVGVHRLTFRKDAAVGPFLREWVSR